MLFLSANIHSLTIFQDTLGTFKRISGLSANPTKSENFLLAVPAHLNHQILEFLQFKEGKLPIIYLGVPLLSSVLQEGNWIWAQARSTNAVSIQSKLCLIDFVEEERPIVNIIVTNQSSSCLKSESGF